MMNMHLSASKYKKVKEVSIAVYGKPTTELRSVTCHMELVTQCYTV